ncbi:hypothetical protein [Christiangramia forsetii]|uniref:Uncharacterized protein n=2 Tax=Christiangramia forsetii TaxID=411153 RepID=A0M6Q1_CHRFK|nr:hypothetical protein [Christiangramia forsetii]GGG29865.1 hypothetical protein GCM10011532_11640 [Christiangramia forsetii]CAL68296.1 hypothetical protein GFO_3355 [Christiangramia forsetii KT0803]
MKKKIEADLIRIAENIIQNKGKLDANVLKEKAKNLYEKLTVLAFIEKHLEEDNSEVAVEKPVQKKAKKVSYDEFYPDGTEYNKDSDAITEPNTEKIKDIVAQMPPETEKVDSMMSQINTAPEPPKSAETGQEKRDFRNIGVDYDNLPDFEPVNHVEKPNKPRSLNDRLKKGINIGLNQRLSYIKHLFGGDTADYNRVLSQLNTFTSLEESRKFIEKVVKPDYNHWEGKEEYEERFMSHIENKFSN